MTSALRKTYQAKPAAKIKSIRENLSLALDLINPVIPETRHIRILANVIRRIMFKLDETRIRFHSKGLLKIRNFGEKLLQEARKRYDEAIEKNNPEECL